MILNGSFQSLSTPQLSIGHSDTSVGRGRGPVCPARCEQSRVQGTLSTHNCLLPLPMYGGADLTSLCPESKQVVKNRYQTSTQEEQTNSGEWEKHAPHGCPSHLSLQFSLWWNVFSTKGLSVRSPSFRPGLPWAPGCTEDQEGISDSCEVHINICRGDGHIYPPTGGWVGS